MHLILIQFISIDDRIPQLQFINNFSFKTTNDVHFCQIFTLIFCIGEYYISIDDRIPQLQFINNFSFKTTNDVHFCQIFTLIFCIGESQFKIPFSSLFVLPNQLTTSLLVQVSDKRPVLFDHYLTTWLQIWYHSLLWRDSIRKGAELEKHNCLLGVYPAVMGK